MFIFFIFILCTSDLEYSTFLSITLKKTFKSITKIIYVYIYIYYVDGTKNISIMHVITICFYIKLQPIILY